MKHLSKTLLALSATLILTSCGGTKVTQEEFNKQAQAVEDHTYTSATLTYDVDENMAGEAKKEKGTIKYTFGEDGWTSEDEKADEYMEYLTVNDKEAANGEGTAMGELPEGVEADVTYYVNPFKIEVKLDADISSEGQTMKVKGSGTTQFDKYGFLTSSVTNFEMSMNLEIMGNKIENESKINDKITISYK